jgi:hypothetical protein
MGVLIGNQSKFGSGQSEDQSGKTGGRKMKGTDELTINKTVNKRGLAVHSRQCQFGLVSKLQRWTKVKAGRTRGDAAS